jgi:hypothetical protein
VFECKEGGDAKTEGWQMRFSQETQDIIRIAFNSGWEARDKQSMNHLSKDEARRIVCEALITGDTTEMLKHINSR